MRAIAAPPEGPVEIPPLVERIAASAGVDRGRIVPVWRNQLGGLTFRLGGDRYLKWNGAAADGSAPAPELDLLAEAKRLAWAGRYITVPEVLDAGCEGAVAGGAIGGAARERQRQTPASQTQVQWLLTRAIPGESAVSPRWIAEPARAAEAIGRGLRALHDALPVAECPFTWSVEERVARFEGRVAAGMTPEEWMPEHRGLTVADVREVLGHPPPLDAVVCHGDACAPNTLLDADGRGAGHVDLGSLGVADRWADLAVAAWSTVWNYGPGYEATVYAAYGAEPEEERIRYYRLLWDVS